MNKDITRVENGKFHLLSWRRSLSLSLKVSLYPLLSMESSTLFSMPSLLVFNFIFFSDFFLLENNHSSLFHCKLWTVNIYNKNNLFIQFMTASLNWIGAGATLILFIALSSILPFWLLISLVPSLRNELPSLHIPIGMNPSILFSFTPSVLPMTPIPKKNPTNKNTVTAVKT